MAEAKRGLGAKRQDDPTPAPSPYRGPTHQAVMGGSGASEPKKDDPFDFWSFGKEPAGSTFEPVKPTESIPWPTQDQFNASDFGQGWNRFWGFVGSAGAVSSGGVPMSPPLDSEGNITDGGVTGQFSDKPTYQAQNQIETDQKNNADMWSQIGAQTQTNQFTQEEFDALTPKQQMFVQAQTQIWDAVQADKTENATLSEEDRAARIEEGTYTDALSALFSKGDGSDVYAPRTLALLNELGNGVSTVDDIDRYLSGQAFLTKAQVRELDPTGMIQSPITDMETNGRDNNPDIARRIIDQQANIIGDNVVASDQLTDILTRGSSLLNSLQSNNDYYYAQGLTGPAVETPLNNLNQQQQEALDYMMDGMARVDTPPELNSYYEQVKTQYGITDEMLDAYASQALTKWEESGTSMGPGYLDPTAFRTKWKVQTNG